MTNAEMTIFEPISFASAYEQLRPAERAFVDGYVARVEDTAERTHQKLEQVLTGPLGEPMDAHALKFLGMALVRAAISERVRQLADEAELSVYKTKKELRSLAYSNLGNYMTIDPVYPDAIDWDFSRCTPEMMAAVKSFEVEQKPMGGRKIKIVLHDKFPSLALLAKIQGIDNDHWEREQAAVTSNLAITGDMPVDEAADAYARLIDGQ